VNTGDALLHACLDNPDDDTPRLVYADWLQENGDPDRAEFIRLQLVSARHWYAGDIPDGVEAREAELRAAHEAEWNPLPPPLRNYAYFDRGFLDHASVVTDDEAATVARYCPEILHVSVGGEDFTDAGLAHLATLPYLEELSFQGIAGATVTGNGMRALARHPRLRRIKLDNITINGSWFHDFRDTPRLVRVDHDHHSITPEEWAAWEEARAVRFRRSSHQDQQRAARAFLFDELEYGGWQQDGRLRLIQMRLTDADVEVLAALPGLQHLDLYQTRITNRALRYLSGLTELRALEIGYNDIDNLDALAGMTQLRELNLIGMYVLHRDGPSDWPLTDAGTVALSTLTGLESLCLSFNPITDVTLARIAGLTKLRKLELTDIASVTDAGLIHLRGLKNLEHLDVRNTAVTARGAKELRTYLPQVKVRRT
jgi:uncharacterized protein (TIGR02996 family)